ncbi:hypothetical protein L0Y49_02995 [bacterium]|nr:hypothetical protein [bacterium]MCI0566223.1 hypothetical protein [bacterium]MCI0679809.1 hypothetical protein [bacterium]
MKNLLLIVILCVAAPSFAASDIEQYDVPGMTTPRSERMPRKSERERSHNPTYEQMCRDVCDQINASGMEALSVTIGGKPCDCETH